MKDSISTSFLFLIIMLMVLVIVTLIWYLIVLKNKISNLLELQSELYTREEINNKELEVQSVKEHFEHIIKTAPVAYILAVQGKIIETNIYATEKIGMMPDMMVRTFFSDESSYDILGERFGNFQALSGVKAYIKMHGGEAHRFHIQVEPVMYQNESGFIAWAMDIEELEQQKDAINKMVDTLPIGMFIVDAKTKQLEYGNYSFLKLFKYATLANAAQSDYSNKLKRFYEYKISDDNKENNTIEFEHQHIKRDGTILNIRIFADEIIYNNKLCIVFVCQDISAEKKQAEMLLRASEKEREANHLKSIFLANMSHEVRTPMNAIIGLSQVALMKHQSSENYDLYRKINVSAKNLLSIINDILDFSKIEAEKLELVEEVFNLEDVISNTFMMASERIGGKKVEILLNLTPNVPLFLHGDKTRLWQILKNLLDNAAKYTEEGRVILNVSVVDEKTDIDKITLLFEVDDTGVGMEEYQIERIFNPFEQFHNNVFKNKKGGTGLGMSITKQLVELLGGEITIESKKNAGTSIAVTLSFHWADITTSIYKMAQNLLDKYQLDVSPVLIADDDSYSLKIMSSLLNFSDIECVCVETGQEVVDTVKKYKEMGKGFKTIIIDYLLGNDNGLEIGQRIKNINKDVKLLMVSAYAKGFITRLELKEAGFADIIEKPFTVSTFIQKLCDTTGNYRVNKAYSTFSTSRVLLCEDNEINQQVAKNMLETFKIVPVTVTNGKEALEVLEKEKFDIILIDIIMPIMDGHELAQAIRNSDKEYKDIVIVAMTANVMKDEIDRCREERMNSHIKKPINIDELYEHLEVYLKKDAENIITNLAYEEIECQQLELPNIDGIDLEEAIQRFGGRLDRYAASLRSFAEGFEGVQLSFEEAVSAKNISETKMFVHTLKGVAGNLGIFKLHEKAVEFEKGLKSGKPEENIYIGLQEISDKIVRDILKEIKNPREKQKQQVIGSQKEYMELMKSLQPFIETYEITSCENILKQLGQKSYGEQEDRIIKEITEKSLNYQFDEVQQILEEIII